MKWLSIVGIGEDGLAGLGERARQAIAGAEIVFGGERHLELAAAAITGESRSWLSPFSRSVEAVVAERNRRVCVLASGDPFHYGVGATLSRHIDASEMDVIPQVSAFTLAAGRLGWPLAEVVSLSLHGRPLDLIRPHLHNGARILALTSDEHGPAALAQLLNAAGFGISIVTVLEALGGPDERIRSQVAMGFALDDVQTLNVCAVTVVALPGARVLPMAAGRDDGLFEHDGQITKREVRALTLSALAPRRGELLWDIGAGSGSVAIEWMLADPSLKAIAIEADGERVARIGRNAQAFGVPDLRVVEGTAPGALVDLPQPHAVFIGGGGSEPGLVEAAIAALPAGGRLVANAVTTEMEAVLLARHADLGGGLTRIDIARATEIGSMTGWRPAMPITQWVWTKP
ncbi:precorrin-6Y methyltransferase [Devosia limi DSM 17137]|uniref:Precorrin-6Y C5,15-methyltransferase (Decarboxylating) n=1 Tax=Devosia limi DSM 17137 TaxID=1121477 RepID=A0A0F5LEH7_9HYPH|nr:bifunctional cobalt-precorrin-7 (C(5))-methyltransferase/cobalt-precorrin-6B (C(15))-methyltransferase [Devosia limi]KKB80589.1 precorrin-6Y methyltransferase [Devosia limi DSM 17137]SHE52166.1 precorrin-6Y C5,15-methyltransferase (decarboxylating) [Devosia limi DSM 17137]